MTRSYDDGMKAPQPVTQIPIRTRGRRRPAPQSRGAVLEATRELLKVRRLDELTVAGIVELAGISRPTFYASFDTKYSVVAALIEDVGDGVWELWQEFFDEDGPITEAPIHKAGIGTMRLWRSQAALFCATVEGWHSDGEIHDVWSAVLERFAAAMERRLHRSRAPRPSDDMLVASLVSAFERALYLAVATPESVFGRSDEELADVLTRIWVLALTDGG